MIKRVYLDNNASTSLDPEVVEYIKSELLDLVGNPSSVHVYGRSVQRKLADARASIAKFLKVKPQEVLFNSGATEGLNMVIRGIFGSEFKGHILTSATEHSAVYSTVKKMEEYGCEATFLSSGLHGAVQVEQVEAAIRPDTKLIALMAANNETGVKTDIAAIASLAKSLEIPFLVDGVALIGKEEFVIPYGVSALCFSGHKLHAPKGVGVTFLRLGLKFDPQIIGGEQEGGKRGGTENILGILAFERALTLLAEGMHINSKKMMELRDRFEGKLIEQLPFVSVNGTGPRTVNTSNLCFAGVDGESLLIQLDLNGIMASHGSACSSGAIEPSRILLAMGLPLEMARSSLRFSLSRFTTEEEIDYAILKIIEIVRSMPK